MMEIAIDEVSTADYFVIIGTSLQVYPAASLIDYVPSHAKIICIDPNEINLNSSIIHIRETATVGVEELRKVLY